MRLLIPTLLLVTTATAQLPNTTTAHVNDTNSHGTLGDSLLSLDEAIRHMNRVPGMWASFSAAEQARFSGVDPTRWPVDLIEVDFADVNGQITLEGQLTTIHGDNLDHVCADFTSLNGRVVIEATGVAGVADVFPSRTNHFHLRNFIVRGGQWAVRTDASLHYHPGVRMLIHNCLFENQTVGGLEVGISPQGNPLPIDVTDTVIRNAPLGFRILDQAFLIWADVDVSNLSVEGCTLGIEVLMKGFNNTVDVDMDRIRVSGATNAFRVTRLGSPIHNSSLDLNIVFAQLPATQNSMEIEAHTGGATDLVLNHARLTAGSGSNAFRVFPATGRTNVTMAEVAANGNVTIESGPTASTLRVHNSQLENGPVRLGSSGAATDFMWNRLDAAPLTMSPGNTTAATFLQCEFHSTAIDNQGSGPCTLTSSFRNASPTTGSVAEVGPAPTPWIGRANVNPPNPAIGTSFDLNIDLPAGAGAVWLLSVPLNAVPFPPYRLYFDLSGFATVGFAAGPGTNTIQLSVPNKRRFSGKELYAQPATFSFTGAPHVPVMLPRADLISIQ